jgi:Mn2+/Fe2+ NRAMP family transporter
VVIGPGSILTSSTIGANNGYSMLWIVVVSVVFMMVYMTMGARLGVVAAHSPGDLLRAKSGSWLAVLVGLVVFFISAAFQSGNNIGVGAAFEPFVGSKTMTAVFVLGFNGLAILFFGLLRNLYRALERLMMVLVAVMLLCFAGNLVMLGIDPVAMFRGLVPSSGTINLAVLGLIGTTFVISAAYYQAYLVRQKGWGQQQLISGLIDARIGSVIMALITIMLMVTGAAGLYLGPGQVVKLADPVAVAVALEPTFGVTGEMIFCLGLFSAAYSSFLVNSMIGGFILADGLGLGSKPTDRWPRILSSVVLLTGMVIALATILLDFDRTPMIIAAQAVTVVGAPLVAGVMLWLTSQKDVMGEHTNGPVVKVLGVMGFLLLLVMAANTAFVKLPAKIEKYRAKQREVMSNFVDEKDHLVRRYDIFEYLHGKMQTSYQRHSFSGGRGEAWRGVRIGAGEFGQLQSARNQHIFEHASLL